MFWFATVVLMYEMFRAKCALQGADGEAGLETSVATSVAIPYC